jgi:hypothetical protein
MVLPEESICYGYLGRKHRNGRRGSKANKNVGKAMNQLLFAIHFKRG